MKKILKFTLVLTFVSSLFFLGCSDKSDIPLPIEQDRFEVLKSYLTENDLDLDDILADGWIITATDVHDNLNDYFIIDIRSETSYNDAHIEGAVNAP